MKHLTFAPLAALLLLSALSPAQAQGVIAFTSERDSNNEIYVMNADGSEPTRLTNAPALDSRPALSPTGGIVAFSRSVSGPNSYRDDIYRINTDGTGLQQLTFNGASDSATFTPDGKKIAYWSFDEASGKTSLVLMKLDGSAKTPLANEPLNTLARPDVKVAFSPDGKKIAFVKSYAATPTQGDGDAIFVVNLDGTGLLRLTSTSVHSTHPAWSPDGSKIAFERYPHTADADEHIYIMNADGSGQKLLVANAYGEIPAFSPNGKKLAFSSYQDFSFRISAVNLDGTVQTPLTPGSFDNTEPSWSVGSIPHTVSAFSISDPSIKEGNSGQKDLTYTVTLQATRDAYRSVDYTVVGATAKAGEDFNGQNGTLLFAPGEKSKTISISVLGDTLSEANETVFVNLSNPVDATIDKSRGIGTIVNDDALPTLRIADTSVTESTEIQQYAIFNVDLSEVSGQTVSVNYQTEEGGSPRATPSVDYAPLSLGTLTFAPGETHKTLRVPIYADDKTEGDEQFVMRISNPINARIVDAAGLATIINAAPRLPEMRIADAQLPEGNAGTSNATFFILLAEPSSTVVTVNYITKNGSANVGNDYLYQSGSLTFQPGETTKSVTIQVKGDTKVESDEDFYVALSGAVGAKIVKDRGHGVIVNDDGAASGASS